MADPSQTAEDLRLAELMAAEPNLAAHAPLPEVADAVAGCTAQSEIVETIMLGYGDRPALGERPTTTVREPDGRTVDRPEARYRTITHREAWTRARAIGTAWRHGPEPILRTGDLLCSLASSSVDYNLLELAAISAGVVSVPLATSGSAAQWASIMRETDPRALAVGVDLLDSVLAALPAEVRPPHLVVLAQGRPRERVEEIVADARVALGDTGTRVHTLAELVDSGLGLPQAPLFVPEPGTEPLAQILYTSGSTGAPKGAMFTEPLLAMGWHGFSQVPRPGVFLHFMPMSHITGRYALVGALARGGVCCSVGSGDLSTLLTDLELVRPTELWLVPRVCELIRDRFAGDLEARTAAGQDRDRARREAIADLRDRVLGGRILMASNGSALLNDEVRALMEELFRIPLHEGYGTTETGSAFVIDNQILRPPVIDYKLVDVPELGYFATDRPYPRGELLVKTYTMISGYYRRPDLDAELFDADGFCRTGDVMALTGPDELRFVDRRNNVLKLSQAEFVAISTVEDALLAAPLVEQVFVHGRAGRSYLVAVIVPTAQALRAHPDPGELRAALTRSIRDQADAAGLRPYEVPRDILVEPEPFSIGNGLLSEVGKPLRPRLDARYADRLEALCADLDTRREDRLTRLRRDAGGRGPLETVLEAAAALTGSPSTPEPQAAFADLGGDSMSALGFASLLRDLYDVEVPVTAIVGPTATLAAVAQVVSDARAGGPAGPTARSVHGAGDTLRAADLTPETFLDPTLLDAAADAPGPGEDPGSVLLTGATGFLGRFVALELLERSSGPVVCLVRGADDAEARRRLDAAFDTGDAELVDRFRTAATDRLQVVAGDVERPQLGLDPGRWAELTRTVDTIVHPAALVNHLLPYEHLFGPNVRGTAEVVRLALTSRRKRIVYLSTIAVGDRMEGPLTEDDDLRAVSPVRRLSDGYAAGYANSKWAAEVLLRATHDRCGVPVTVLRTGMILAHRRFRGQLNRPDMFTRLVLSILHTGLAPTSFHGPGGEASPYGGLPVDVVADAVVRLGTGPAEEGWRVFHVTDPDPGGASLDTVVDWLAESGAEITRVDDPQDWLRRFEIGLHTLDERVAAFSALPLLDALRAPGTGTPPAAPSTTRFVAAARAAGLDGTGEVPGVDRHLVRKYVTDLQALGLR
ncbi:carboxylic acid reductase [Pseudonocardia sp. NPDC046786]|uniref:carboxylic acid reductase n=1 Tax=Pseudonocardia sp. NPDC046786 TaxID=3155471 RepID=UPI0033CEBBB3